MTRGMSAKEKTPLSEGAVASLQSLDFIDCKACSLGNDIQRNAIVAKSETSTILQPTVIRKRHFATYGLPSAETLECMYFNEAA